MAFAPLPPSTKSFLLLLFLVVLPCLSHQQRIRLIHRDSPESPLFDSSSTTTAEKYWRRIHRRSVAYRDHFQAALEGRRKSLTPLAVEDEEAGFDQVGGEYLMEFTIGTPPVRVTGMVDVAGDFIGTQCVPCPGCSPSPGPLYDPSKSSTRTFSCLSNECLSLERNKCSGDDNCEYILSYANDVPTSGVLTSDVFTINDVTYTHMPFGCSSDDSFYTRLVPAMVGLTGSEIFSLVFRFSSQEFTFSHCFMKDWDNPFAKSSSDLHLGKDARLNGRTSSPPARCPVGKASQFFSPTLRGMGVGPENLNLTEELVGGECSTVFVLSTPLTFLRKPLFDLVVSKVREHARLSEAPRRPNDP